MMELICVFSTGRTGTGYLSQVFSPGPYAKDAMHLNHNAIVTHEGFRDIKHFIRKIKQTGYTDDSRAEANEVINSIIKSIRNDYNVEKLFITDHRVGRMFAWALDIEVKVIKINRSKEDVTNSFLNRLEKTKSRVSQETYNRFYSDVWSMSFYHPDDSYIQDAESSKLWGEWEDKERLNWYWEETEKQWCQNKCSSIEIEFSELFTEEGISKISNFIDLPYIKDKVGIRANK